MLLIFLLTPDYSATKTFLIETAKSENEKLPAGHDYIKDDAKDLKVINDVEQEEVPDLKSREESLVEKLAEIYDDYDEGTIISALPLVGNGEKEMDPNLKVSENLVERLSKIVQDYDLDTIRSAFTDLVTDGENEEDAENKAGEDYFLVPKIKLMKKKKLLKILTGPHMMAVVRQLLEMLLHGEDDDEGDIPPIGRHYRPRSMGSLNSYGGGFNYGDDEDKDDAPEKRDNHKIKDDKKKKTKADAKKN